MTTPTLADLDENARCALWTRWALGRMSHWNLLQFRDHDDELVFGHCLNEAGLAMIDELQRTGWRVPDSRLAWCADYALTECLENVGRDHPAYDTGRKGMISTFKMLRDWTADDLERFAEAFQAMAERPGPTSKAALKAAWRPPARQQSLQPGQPEEDSQENR